MLRIVLILVAGFAGTMTVHINVTRTYFWLNEHKRQNFYIKASPLEKDGEDSAVNNGSEDLRIEWFREVAYDKASKFWPEFYLDYGDKYPKVFTGFDVCMEYDQHTKINFAQDFFNKILANYPRDYQCPLEKRKNILSPGNLQWDRHRSEGVECDTPVTVTLVLSFFVGNGDYNWANKQTYTKRKILETIFKGEFVGC